jgi:hypothetical protein
MNYKAIADLMLAMPTNQETLTKNDFNDLMQVRNLEFIQGIEGLIDGEVWGNSTFCIIVIHSHNTYKIL